MAKILITDGNYPHTLGIIRSLIKLGNKVDFIGNNFCLSSFTNYGSNCVYKKSLFNEKNIKNFLIFLRKEKYDFLIPIGAESVKLVNKYRLKISKETIINLAPYKSILLCLSKDKTLEFAKERGLLIPKTFTDKFIKQYLNRNKKLPCKLVIKSKFEISNLKVAYINTPKDYKAYKFNSSDNLIQEYINGYGIGFFAIYENGNLKNFFMHKRIREFPSTGGSSLFAQSIFEKEVFEFGKLILDALKWHGVAMVEFKKEILTNKLYLMEINPKFWGSHDLAISSGINFAKEYILISNNKFSNNFKIFKSPTYKIGIRFQWPARDIISNIFRPDIFLESLLNFLNPRINNNLYLRDPLPSLYLICSAVFYPILKIKFFKYIFLYLLRVRNFGPKIAFVRTFTEITGIPLLKYSKISKNIALGMQPKLFGYYFLKYNKYEFILNLRSEYNNSSIKDNFKLLNIPVREYDKPTLSQLNKGADFIHNVVSKNKKIYIHCREGISRAPTFLIAYYIKYEKIDVKEAIKKIFSKRKFINILESQLSILRIFEKKNNKNLN